jgi:Cd2+/Zn2+-exporting ATPase
VTNMEDDEKKQIIRIAVTAALGAAAWAAPAQGALKLALFLVPYALISWDIIKNAAVNIVHGEVFDENFLMTIATVGAFAVGEYPEAVAVMLFYQVGELFQDMAVGKSRRSISELMDIRPDRACVLRGGAETVVSPEEVAVGETIIVRPGEKIPLDGIVTEGSTSVDTAALTGESMPRSVGEGENVVSGSVDLDAVIKVKVTSAYGESTVAKILELVGSASEKKAKAENFITRFAKIYTPCVVAGAVLLALLPPLAFGLSFDVWLRRALIFLVVSCPCALVISVPLSFFGGIGGASRSGILIKGANYLEALSKVSAVVFDKTGTLTKGTFSVSAVHPTAVSQAELIDIAALAESYSSHPIAESIVRAHAGHIDKSRIGRITERAGLGVEAVIDGRRVLAGSGKLMQAEGIDWHECHLGGTAVHIAADGVYCGHIIISDEVKPDSAAAIKELKACGVEKTVMLTGDSESAARPVGEALGIDEVHAGLMPDGKVAAVEKLISEKPANSTLAFVGDGINDAPVLSRADLGIAMGAMGSDAAIEAADVVLMDDKPSKLPEAVKISRRTMTIVHENIIFALAVKAIVLVLGAMGTANMWFAVFADVGVTIIAVANATRTLGLRTRARA